MEDAVNSLHGTAVYFASINLIPKFYFVLEIFTEVFQVDFVFSTTEESVENAIFHRINLKSAV